MSVKIKLTDHEKLALIGKLVAESMANIIPNFEFVIFVSAIIFQEEISLTDLGWGSSELEKIRTPMIDRPCFSCRPGEEMEVKYHVPRFGYNLCEFHANAAMVVGWEIFPITTSEAPKV